MAANRARAVMRVPFTKMHGLGNDFIMLDGRASALPEMTEGIARALANRRTGIGCDQLIVLLASDSADFRMRIFNHDGGEVEACGNASRAVALLHGQDAQVETAGGLISVSPNSGGASVDMGAPSFDWEQIPLAYAMDTLELPLGWDELEQPTAVNVGNPHAVFFVPNVQMIELERLGPIVEKDPVFPERVNVNVASVVSKEWINLRVWERGVGLTQACGTGACATAVAAMRRGLVDRTVTVALPGGELAIEWRDDDHIIMTGPATTSFTGEFEWDDFA